MTTLGIRDTLHSAAESHGHWVGSVEVNPAHMPGSVVLPGINTAWQPQATNVGDTLSDIDCLLEQAIAVFMESNDLSQPQWGAVQQLAMAHHLFSAVHTTIIKLNVIGE